MDNGKTDKVKKITLPIGQRIKSSLKRKIPALIVVGLIFSFLLAFLSNRIVHTIGPGQRGVLFKRFFGGTVLDKVYPEGVRLIWPWDRLYIYDTRIQELKHEMNVLAQNGLTFHLSLSIRFHPEIEFLGMLHQVVGPDYAQKVVIPEVEAVLRTLLGNLKPEEVYTTHGDILERYMMAAMTAVGEKFIELDEDIISSIGLPPPIKEAIENKLKQQQLAQEYEFKLQREKKEKERKEIEALGIQKFQDIVSLSLTDKLLKWKGIEATLELAKSTNAKVIVIGGGKDGLPIILDTKTDYGQELKKNEGSNKKQEAINSNPEEDLINNGRSPVETKPQPGITEGEDR